MTAAAPQMLVPVAVRMASSRSTPSLRLKLYVKKTIPVTTTAASVMVLTPAWANCRRFSLKPKRIIPNRKNLLLMKPMPSRLTATIRGASWQAIPNNKAMTKAPTKFK